MNSTNQTPSDESNFIQILVTAKAGLYFVNFIFITAMGILIIKTVRQNSNMKKEIRYILLCHHLLCSSLSCCFGTMLNAVQNAKVQTFWIWIIFGVQTAVGESVLITLALMALNTCFAVCQPLRYFALVHSFKNKVMVSIWVVTMLKALCLILVERTEKNPMDIYKAEASCPTILGGNFATISGIILISLLAATIIISYFFLCREGKIAGHFNNSNKKARKTIIIHALQMSFHILPPLIITAIGKEAKHTNIRFGAFVVFCFAQSFSPIVYGLRNKELKDKMCIRQDRCQYSNYSVNNNNIPPEVFITECSADRNAICQCTSEGPQRQ
ncbi:olfactory receptor 6B9 [Anolis carolinensis]|uniref:olfactory receptor 6B9 n=1 Tax=Anolis carolinensis TaxID=28377 RepID=UPI002F2B2320